MKLQTLNNRIENLKKELRNTKVKKAKFLSSQSLEQRKKRTRNLIILGANFEILGYEKEHTATILGFLKENIHLINEKRAYYKNIGEKILEERSKEKENNSNQQITTKELKELMNLSKTHNISNFIQKKFNKSLWETLTFKEFETIIEFFNTKKE